MEDSRKPLESKLDNFFVGKKTCICFEYKGQDVEWPCLVVDKGDNWIEVLPYTAIIKLVDNNRFSFAANRKLEEIQSVDREGNVINTGRYMLV